MNAFEAVGWAALLLNLWGNLALTGRNAWGWLIRLACNVTWIVYSAAFGVWPLLANHAVFMVVNVVGWLRWTRRGAEPACCSRCCRGTGWLCEEHGGPFDSCAVGGGSCPGPGVPCGCNPEAFWRPDAIIAERRP